MHIYRRVSVIYSNTNSAWQSGDGCVTFRRLSDDSLIIHRYTQEGWCDIQWVRQRYCTHSGAVFSRLGNNNTESAWQSADSRVTVRRLSRNRSAIFFKSLPFCLKRQQKVVWQSADGCVTSDDCRVTVQRLFSKFCNFSRKYVVSKSADGRVTDRLLCFRGLFVRLPQSLTRDANVFLVRICYWCSGIYRVGGRYVCEILGTTISLYDMIRCNAFRGGFFFVQAMDIQAALLVNIWFSRDAREEGRRSRDGKCI